MIEVLVESIRPVNLPFTLLMMCVVAYWLMVALGLFHFDSGAGVEADLDGGVEGDLDGGADFGGESEIQGEAQIDSEVGAEHDVAVHQEAHGMLGEGGVLSHMLHFVNVGEVPLMVIASVLALSMWLTSMLVNHYLENTSVLKGLLFLAPNVVLSAVITRYATLPLKRFFAMLNKEYDEHKPLVGQTCIVMTSEVTSDFGQAQIETKGAPLLIHVRTSGGESLRKGETALVVREDKQKNVYYVVKVTADKLEV